MNWKILLTLAALAAFLIGPRTYLGFFVGGCVVLGIVEIVKWARKPKPVPYSGPVLLPRVK